MAVNYEWTIKMDNEQKTSDKRIEQKTLKLETEQKLNEIAKAAGFKNLNELVFYSGTARQTLTGWLKKHPDRFDAILKGAIMRKVEALKNGRQEKD